MITIDELSRSLKDSFEPLNKRLDDIDTRLDDIDTRLDGIDTRLDGIDTRLDGIDTRLDGIDTRFRSVETDIAWIKGKFEGRQEGRANVWQLVTTATAVGAAVIALIALFLN